MLKSTPPVFLNIFVNMGNLGNLPLTFKLKNDTLVNNLMRTKVRKTSASERAPASIDCRMEILIL